MNDLETLFSAISAAMDSPFLAGRAASLTGTAQISLMAALAGFLMFWKSLERNIAEGIAATGELQWSMSQSIRAVCLMLLLATLLDASLLAAALGEPAHLLASQAIRMLSESGLPADGLERVYSDARISTITQAVQGQARSALLHAAVSFGTGLFIIICIALDLSSSFKTHRYHWLGLALALGVPAWPDLTGETAWAALSGDIEPYLRTLLAL